MPRDGIICVIDQQSIPDEACLACRRGTPRAGRHCHYPYEFLAAMMNRRGRETAHYSATMLAGPCPRKVWLEQRISYALSPDQMIDALRGTMAHQLAESWPEPDCLYETRFELPLTLPSGKAVILTGQVDKLCLGTRTISDFKTRHARKGLPRQPEPSHIFQLNCYRWLVSEGWPQCEVTIAGQHFEPGVPAGIAIDRLVLWYWSEAPSRGQPSLVALDAPLVDVKDQVLARLEQLAADRPPLIPRQLDPGRSPFCLHWCPVRQACLERLEEEACF